MRIMKGRKKISHAELIGEVIVATKSRGVLDPGDIKKNIEKWVSSTFFSGFFFVVDFSRNGADLAWLG